MISQFRSITALTNPAAGRGTAPGYAERAIAQFQRRGVNVVEIVGKDPDDALVLANQAIDHGTQAIVVIGGDGVIATALQAIGSHESDIPLGIIPAGTGNDSAREFGLPVDDPEAAADVIVDGYSDKIDLGMITFADGRRRWFGTVMAVGFDSLVSDRTNRMKWPHGRMRYNFAIVAELLNLKPLPFKLVLDGERVIEKDLTLAAMGNTRSYGGGMRIAPGADPRDGMLDVTVIDAGKRLKLISTFPRVFKGTHIELDEVTVHRAARVHVEANGINAYADGEFAGPLPADVEVLPLALNLIMPKPKG